jgi:hypothetical protein
MYIHIYAYLNIYLGLLKSLGEAAFNSNDSLLQSVYMYMHEYKHMYTYLYIYIYIYIHIYKYTYLGLLKSLGEAAFNSNDSLLHTYMYTCIFIYIYSYTYLYM